MQLRSFIVSIRNYRQRSTTIKITYNKVDFVMFYAKEDDVNVITNGGNITIVYSLGLNEYGGVTSAQGIIERYEIEQNTINWDDIFQ